MRRPISPSPESPASRSARMALIRAKDTKPELRVRRALHAAGLRYRLHRRDLPGCPDLVFSRWRTIVLVHGCFWHQHANARCKLARMPKSRLEFWLPKLKGNRRRDQRVKRQLRQLGWRVVEVWECQINPTNLRRLAHRIVGA